MDKPTEQENLYVAGVAEEANQMNKQNEDKQPTEMQIGYPVWAKIIFCPLYSLWIGWCFLLGCKITIDGGDKRWVMKGVERSKKMSLFGKTIKEATSLSRERTEHNLFLRTSERK